MSVPWRAEWDGASRFAEVAETVGVNTDQVIAAILHGEVVIVLFSPTEGSRDVYATWLARDAEKILREIGDGNKRLPIPDFWTDIEAAVSRALETMPDATEGGDDDAG